MCVWDMCIYMGTCIWTPTALDTHIRAYEWTHAMLMHISTFTYTHVLRCICWYKLNRCVHLHTYKNFHVFAHICDLSICTCICEHAHTCLHVWFKVIQTIYRLMQVSHSVVVIVEVDFLWNRTVDSLKTSFHSLLWTSSGLRDSWKTTPYMGNGKLTEHAQEPTGVWK